MRTIVRLALIVVVAWLMYRLVGYMHSQVESLTPQAAMMRWSLLFGLLLTYALLIAVPFVPGVEIGLTMIAMGGSSLAPFVYLATVMGLVVAYLVGRCLPYDRLARVLVDLRLTRLSQMLEALRPMSREERLETLQHHLPRRLRRLDLRWRYLLLALLINLPGSTLIGGGGGICLLAGLTRLFHPAATLATIALAVMPLPLGVWLWFPGLLAQ